ncbi:MAG TPA: hypothetical protein VE737_08635, partial [Actinomycetota bacterium]|nr:hypothetical protein [Actinomycetota bacterium]
DLIGPVPRYWLVIPLAAAYLAGCASSGPEKSGRATPGPTSSPASTPTSTPIPPVLYFNLTEEDALSYLEALDERIEEALHDGDLGALHDLFIGDGPARREIARRIIRTFQRRLVDRTRYEPVSTKVLRITSQLAVFRQVRLVYPCVYTYDDWYDVTPDDRVMRQVVIRRMADEQLNWRIEREVVRSEKPIGEKVTACPP